MTDILKTESYISLVYEKLVDNLQAELAQHVSNPVIKPVSFHIDFKKQEAPASVDITFYNSNGSINGKMINLARNNSVVLNYAFRIGEENNEMARGMFKVKISDPVSGKRQYLDVF